MENSMSSSSGYDVPADAEENTASKVKPGRSTLVSRNVTIAGHRTSIRLEPEMWSGLAEISRRERMIMHEVCTAVATHKKEATSLTAAIRVFVMAYFRSAATEDGHNKAGHGYGGLIAAAAAVVPAAPPTNNSRISAFVLTNGKMDGTRRF